MEPIHEIEVCAEYWKLYEKYADTFQLQFTAKELENAYYEMRAHWYTCDKCKAKIHS